MKYLIKILLLSLITSCCIHCNTYSIEPISEEGNIDKPKIVYLTFDDGPTKINTPKLLDELKRLNLHATFFVVGKLINENPDVLHRIIQENHSVGLHTMSHNRDKCYSSQENFIKENDELRQLIKTNYNYLTNIVRFPFGSQNSYLKMDKTFLNKLHNNDFKIFDWHIDTTDALNPTRSPEEILKICERQYEKFYKNNFNIVILMHTNSNNDNTIKSIEHIKNFFINLGYEFDVLRNDSQELYNIK